MSDVDQLLRWRYNIIERFKSAVIERPLVNSHSDEEWEEVVTEHMNSKVLMLLVAVIAVGLFALPSTLSMFAGQHSWYDPKDSGGIPCTKCHFIEKQELSGSNGPHSTGYTKLVNTSMNYSTTTDPNGTAGGINFWGGANSDDDRCYGCHQRAGSNDSSHSLLAGSWDLHRNDQHAAIAVWCIDCHPWVETELTHDKAAHRWFYEDLNSSSAPSDNIALQKPNRACLGCHTHVGVNLTWERNEFVSYDVNCDKTGYNVTWNTSDDCGINESQSGSVPGYS